MQASGVAPRRKPAWREFQFVQDRRSEGVSWKVLATMLGVSDLTARRRYLHRDAGGEKIARAWAEHGPEAKALIDLLLQETCAAGALTVYLVMIQRQLAAMAVDQDAQDLVRGVLDEAFEAVQPDVPAPSPPPPHVVVATPPVMIDGTGTPARKPGLRVIVERVAAETGVAADLILGDERTRDVTAARDFYCWAARAGGYTLDAIGKAAGGRHHSTILTAIRRHEMRRAQQGSAA